MSDELAVVLEQDAYRPGERVRGQAAWQCSKAPRRASVRLFWQIRGSGVEDAQVVDVHEIAPSQPSQEEAFEFCLPDEPYSYRGALFEIAWGVELLVDGRAATASFAMFAGEPKAHVPGQTPNSPRAT